MRGALLIFMIFCGLTLIFMAPALPHLTTAVIGDGGDNYQFLGFQYLANRLVSSGHPEMGWTDYWRFPFGIDLDSATDSMLFITLGLLLYRFTNDAVLVYNVSVLMLVFLNLVLSYVAFRTWFSRNLALIGAIIYGLSFYSLAKVGGHVNLISTAGFPLFFASVCNIWRYDGRRRDFAMMAGSAAYLTLASLQYPLLLAGVLPFLIVLLFVFERAALAQLLQVFWQKKILLLASMALTIVVVAPFEGRKLMEFLRGETILPSDQFVVVPPINLVLPNAYIPTISSAIPNSTRSWIEYSIFLGFAEVVLLGMAVVRLRSNRGAHFLFACAAVLLVLTLGWWPYRYLFRVMPYRGIIEPGRFFVALYLPITLLILLLLQRIEKSTADSVDRVVGLSRAASKAFFLESSPSGSGFGHRGSIETDPGHTRPSAI